MAALANFFRIKAAYFTDDEYYEKLDKELQWLCTMRDDGVPPDRAAGPRVALRGAAEGVGPDRSSCGVPKGSTLSP
ncbi:hypothetical protein I917_27045 [Mycobacterium tuberculosis str. Haarlem/NITR202]|uniref:Uncharacterized protein n=1 Tax=Mycobacterium tuberculosis str. Haarlem/NITR202 TaxID=1304279 RepID=R4MBU1_MYCTX|nr:hypothetical protein I917_27045 [Mycobacterium tuberculosis str. Haarlem/NITR202]